MKGHVLDVEILAVALVPAFAAESRLLDTAKGSSRVGDHALVEPDRFTASGAARPSRHMQAKKQQPDAQRGLSNSGVRLQALTSVRGREML